MSLPRQAQSFGSILKERLADWKALRSFRATEHLPTFVSKLAMAW
jgi:hypothetical protein